MDTPIFYDESGRRWHRARLLLFAAAILAVLTAVGFLASLVLREVAGLEAPGPAPGTASWPAAEPRHRTLADFAALGIVDPLTAMATASVTSGGEAAGSPITTGTTDADPRIRIGFVDANDMSMASLRRNGHLLDAVVGSWLTIDGDGAIRAVPEVADHIGVVKSLPSRPRVLALVSDSADAGTPLFTVPELLRSPSDRLELARELARQAATLGVDGVVVDFERTAAEVQSELVDFLAVLRTELGDGRTLAVTAPLAGRHWNYRGLAGAADHVILSAFDQHSARGFPGPLAHPDWLLENAAKRMLAIPGDKLVFALASYAREWSTDGTTATFDYGEAMLRARRTGSPVTFDAASGSSSFSYTDLDRTRHQVEILDAVSLYNQILRLQELRPQALALRHLGSEESAVWPIFASRTPVTSEHAGHLGTPSHDYGVHFTNRGEIVHFETAPSDGRREVTTDPEDGHVVTSAYTELPGVYALYGTGASPGRIALSFDDGPNPVYTNAILDILREKNVKASFFVLGARTLSHPDVVRRIVDEGHDIGSHSFSHLDMTILPDVWNRLELSLTHRAIQVATGRGTTLFRPPYSSPLVAGNPGEAHIVQLAAEAGYVSVGTLLDSKDWARTDPDGIVRATIAEVEAGDGSIILLHDAGGDRTPTVQALPRIIDELRQRGYEFAPVSELMGTTQERTAPPVAEDDAIWINAAALGFGALGVLSDGFRVLAFLGLGLALLRLSILLGACAAQRLRERKADHAGRPSVAVLVPAYNEAKVIVGTIRALLRSDYDRLDEIIVIDDGSTDDTSAVVARAFLDEPRVRLFTRPNGGKAAALNFGIRQTAAEVVVTIDADTHLEPQAVRMLARHFDNSRLAAVAGNAKVGNRLNLLTRWQAIEYITGQNLERRALAFLNAVTVVPGAIGAWRRSAVVQTDGFGTQTLAEDCDLTMTLLRHGHIVAHEPDAVAWTEAPETTKALMKQRFRWMYGTLQTAFKHRHTLFRPRYGGLGCFTLPSILLFAILLPLISPILDILIVYSLIMALLDALALDARHSHAAGTEIAIVGGYAIFVLLDLALSFAAFAMEPRERKSLLAWQPLQRIYYRQIMYIVAVRVLFASLKGIAVGWNKLDRKGTVGIPNADSIPAE